MPLTSKKWRKWIWDDMKEQIHLNVSSLVNSLSEEMFKKENDW